MEHLGTSDKRAKSIAITLFLICGTMGVLCKIVVILSIQTDGQSGSLRRRTSENVFPSLHAILHIVCRIVSLPHTLCLKSQKE